MGGQDEETARYGAEQEVRFAVVLYGGVSLAIYINGVTQELFRLVQATAPDPARGSVARLPDERLAGSALVYRELGRRLGLRGLDSRPGGEAGAGDARPIRTRFVVDVLSGTSAGGINGILLAKALANGGDFGISRELWIETADIGALLARGRRPRRSLLGGDLLYEKAREILARLGGETGAAPYAEQLDLAVTATDLTGLPTRLALRYGDGSEGEEPEHRTVFELSRGTRATSGADHSDFAAEHDRLLAFAGRATSAFPVAFEPVALAALPPDPADRPTRAEAELQRRLFAAYPRSGVEPEAVWFADGGYLDNKPFSYATRALRRRRADLPVTRRLLYVEPHPAPAAAARDRYDGRPPSLLDNVRAATVGLKGFESIRQDVADLAERNGRVARLRAIEADAALAIAALDPADAAPGAGAGAAVEAGAGAEARAGAGDASRAAYRSLRVRATLDRVAEIAAALGGWETGDACGHAVREALRGWSQQAGGDGERALLDELDAAFVHRRSSFLHDRVNELLRGSRPPQHEQFAAACGVVVPEGDGGTVPLRRLKEALNDALVPLREVEWTVSQAAPAEAGGAEPAGARPAGAADGAEPAPTAAAADPLAAARDAARALARAAGGEEGLRAAGELVTALGAVVGPRLGDAAGALRAAIERTEGLDEQTRALLRAYDDRFPLFDAIVLPIAHPALGEVNVTDVWRVSPYDTDGLGADPAKRLAGTRLRRFGGFLDAGWRRNDLLWGRLDGADAILDAVLPGPAHEADRTSLRRAAQAAILREELRLEGSDDEVLRAFADGFRAPPSLSAATWLGLAARLLPRALVTLARGMRPGPSISGRSR